MEIISKTLGIEDGKEPVGTVTALDTPAFEDLVSVVKFGTETQRTCVAARTCVSSQHSRCLHCGTQPSSRSSRRGRAGGQSQYITTCSGLRPPRLNGQARSGAAQCRPICQAQGRFTAGRLGMNDGTACCHACPSGHPLPRTVRGLRPAQPVWVTRAEGALSQSSSQPC